MNIQALTADEPTESKNSTTVTSLFSSSAQAKERMGGNIFLVWINPNVDETTEDFQNNLAQLQDIVNHVRTFTLRDEAIDFLTDHVGMTAFLIVYDNIAKLILPLIHDIPHLDAIYILTNDQCQKEPWTNKWTKIRGVYKEIPPICEALKPTTQQCEHDSIAMSFISMDNKVSTINLNQLDPSFMYTQLMKEILLEMEDDTTSIPIFTDYCRRIYKDNKRQLDIIDEFERTYRSETAIWWYTRQCFIFQMLNQALRELQGDAIINMGFFIRHLHQQIQLLHATQVQSYGGQPFTVYRGQGLSKVDFEKHLKTRGALMCFNNFLSTTKKEDVSLVFAKKASARHNFVGIVFRIVVNPATSSSPFAAVEESSCFRREDEILFSMNTVFRIGDIVSIDPNNFIYQVDLTLTNDDDKELRTLTDSIRIKTVCTNRWDKLGRLLIDISQLGKAEELYSTLLQQVSEPLETALYCHQLVNIKARQGDYETAHQYAAKSMEMCQKSVPANHPNLAACYGYMAVLYRDMGEYSKALSFHEKALVICHKSLSLNHPDLNACYGNMAVVYHDMGEYSKALSFYEKDLEIKQKTLPANHPSLATCYGNMGVVYRDMGEYSKALLFHEKDLEIKQKTLPANHPDLATCYGNMGVVYRDMGEYSKALSFHEKHLEIKQKILPANHPNLATCYDNMGLVYRDMEEYSKALSFYNKCLEICQQSILANHPSLATCYGNMGVVYRCMGEYSKALSFYEKDLEIKQKILPANHPSLATCYGNMAGVYRDMGEYSKALSFYEKDLAICQKSLSLNHPDLAVCYGNMAGVYRNMGEYSKALWFYEKSLQIKQKILPANHRNLAACYGNMAGVYRNMGEYSKALSFYEKDLEIKQKTLPANHPSLATCYGNMATVYADMGEYSKALSFYEKDLAICQKSLSLNHPHLAVCYGNMAVVYGNMGEYSKALSFYEKSLQIKQKVLPANHPDLAACYGNMAVVYGNMGEYSKALLFHEKNLEICLKPFLQSIRT